MAEPRYRRRKEDRPEEITAAAFEAFAEKGYDATKVEDVARRAGVSKGLMYLYFKTKQALFEAVVEASVLRLRPILMTTGAMDNDDDGICDDLDANGFLDAYPGFEPGSVPDPATNPLFCDEDPAASPMAASVVFS